MRLSALIDYIWPPRSLLGDEAVGRPGAIAASAWSALRFLTPPWCVQCGLPFSTPETAAGLHCAACLADPPPFEMARAPLAYDDAARPLVLDLKRGGRRDGLATFAGWMAHAGADALEPGALLAPVPLHWTRLAQRRFNQAAWLAEAIAVHTPGLELARDLLVRTKRRVSQGGLTAKQRQANVAGAFTLNRAWQSRVRDRTVVLVDDVFTTGATVSACARALKRGGVSRVCVIALARVLRPTDLER